MFGAIDGYGPLDVAVLFAAICGAATAGVLNTYWAFHGYPARRKLHAVIGTLAFVNTTAYILLLMSDISPGDWGRYVRYIGVVSWFAVWIWVPWRGQQAMQQAENAGAAELERLLAGHFEVTDADRGGRDG